MIRYDWHDAGHAATNSVGRLWVHQDRMLITDNRLLVMSIQRSYFNQFFIRCSVLGVWFVLNWNGQNDGMMRIDRLAIQILIRIHMDRNHKLLRAIDELRFICGNHLYATTKTTTTNRPSKFRAYPIKAKPGPIESRRWKFKISHKFSIESNLPFT